MFKSPHPLAPLLIICLLALNGCDSPIKPSQSLEVAAKGIHGAALSEKGEHAVLGSIHHGGSFWRIESQERVFNWNHKTNEFTTITSADFSYSGEWALTADPVNLVLWDTQTGRGERFWTAPGEILDAELGPNANMAILGLSDHSAVIFNIKQGGILRTLPHNNRVRSVDLSRDGSLALTGSEDYTATLWDVSTGEKINSIKHGDDVQLVKLSPDGSLALSVSKYDKALLWQTRTGKVLAEIPLRAQHIKRGILFTCARFSEDNSLLITGRPDGLVELWRLENLATTTSPVSSETQAEAEASPRSAKVTVTKIARWALPKRDKWKPTAAAAIDVSFTAEAQTYLAVASNGFIHTLRSDALSGTKIAQKN